ASSPFGGSVTTSRSGGCLRSSRPFGSPAKRSFGSPAKRSFTSPRRPAPPLREGPECEAVGCFSGAGRAVFSVGVAAGTSSAASFSRNFCHSGLSASWRTRSASSVGVAGCDATFQGAAMAGAPAIGAPDAATGAGDSARPGEGSAVGVSVLEAVHGGEREEPDLSQEGLGQALRDEHDARRPAVSATLSRYETPDGLGVLERPRVGLDDPEEHRVVAREAERDERGRPAPIQADELDRRATEIDCAGEDAESGFDCLGVFGDEHLELRQVLDFAAPECQFHLERNRATGVPAAVAPFGPTNQYVTMGGGSGNCQESVTLTLANAIACHGASRRWDRLEFDQCC